MEEQSAKSDKYFFFENEAFIFPKTELDAVKREWKRREFFPDGYTLPTKLHTKRIQKDKPFMMIMVILFPKKAGIIKKGLEKIKKLVNPLAGLTSQKPQAPPLPQTPMPNVAAAAMQKSPQTGLTRTETALLSPSEQELLQGEHDTQKCKRKHH